MPVAFYRCGVCAQRRVDVFPDADHARHAGRFTDEYVVVAIDAHDNDAVVTQLVDLEVVLPDTRAERGDERTHFLRSDHLVEAGAFDIENLALQRQHGLRAAVAALFGRATCGVSLH